MTNEDILGLPMSQEEYTPVAGRCCPYCKGLSILTVWDEILVTKDQAIRIGAECLSCRANFTHVFTHQSAPVPEGAYTNIGPDAEHLLTIEVNDKEVNFHVTAYE